MRVQLVNVECFGFQLSPHRKRLNFSDNLTAVSYVYIYCTELQRPHWDTWESCTERETDLWMEYQTTINASIFPSQYRRIGNHSSNNSDGSSSTSKNTNKNIQTTHRDANVTADADSACLFHRAHYLERRKTETREEKEKKINLPQNTMT